MSFVNSIVLEPNPMKTARIQLKNDFTPYPEYKDSGISWIGEIPKGWGVYRAKTLFKRMNRMPLVTDEIVTAFRDGTVTLRKNRREDGFTMADKEIGYQRIEKGDLIIHGMDAFAGAIGVSDSDGKASPVYSACKPIRNADTKYYAYLLRHMSKSNYIFALAKGIRERSTEFRYKEFSNLLVVQPSLETQKKIAEYLDEKTVLIDQIIEKKKKMIELLREKRTAVINDAMMNSDGELGKIKYYVSINPSKKAVSMTDQTSVVSFVPMEALSETGHLIAQERKYEDVKEGFTYFESGDVVLAKITPCYENGKAGVIRGLKNNFGFGTTEFMVLRANKKIVSEYLYFLIFSDKFRKSGEVEMRGTAGQKRVSNSFVKNYEFRLPNLENQRGVVKELERRTELIDSAFRLIENSIEVLKEFKSSLISNVVTGKIKV